MQIASGQAERGWQSDPVPLTPGEDFRLEGWVRAADGEARLGVDLLDDDGRLLRSIDAARVKGVSDWRYVAIEFAAAGPRARVWFAAQGSADLDDVALGPIARFLIWAIATCRATPRDASAFGAKKRTPVVAEGQRAGSHRSDPAAKRRELPSLLVESTRRLVRRLVASTTACRRFTDKIRLSGWARADAAAAAQILACWMDDKQKVLRVDRSAEIARRRLAIDQARARGAAAAGLLRFAWWPSRGAGACGSTSSTCCICDRREPVVRVFVESGGL